MAPIRRYLRITRTSALEVRIYLEKPSDTPWLLSSRDPALPRIIKLIRPKVLPKLREENENSKKKGGKKKKNIKDVASQGDFEVAMFLTDTSTRHSLITKHKQFVDKPPIKSTGNRMTGTAKGNAIDLSADDGIPSLQREDSEGDVNLADIPSADDNGLDEPHKISSDEDDEAFEVQPTPASRRRRARPALPQQLMMPAEEDDKKKLAVNTTYDSFGIYGKILCLIVKRKGPKKTTTAAAAKSAEPHVESQMMEQWVSTQADAAPILDDAND